MRCIANDLALFPYPAILFDMNNARMTSLTPDQVRRSVVSGAVPVWVSPRTLVPDGTALMRTAL